MAEIEKLTTTDANSDSFKSWGKKFANFELVYDANGHLVTYQEGQILVGYVEKLGDEIVCESETKGCTWKLGDPSRPQNKNKESLSDLLNPKKPKLSSFVKVHHDHKNYEKLVADYRLFVANEAIRFKEAVKNVPEGSYQDSGTRSEFWENLR
jgi:hypothetical protein